MDIEKLFDPNSYTEEAMPLTTAFCRAINDLDNLDHNSAAVNACSEKYGSVNNQFFNTLTKEQKDLYVEVQWGDMEQTGIVSEEYFNRGLKFGILLMKELLK